MNKRKILEELSEIIPLILMAALFAFFLVAIVCGDGDKGLINIL